MGRGSDGGCVTSGEGSCCGGGNGAVWSWLMYRERFGRTLVNPCGRD